MKTLTNAITYGLRVGLQQWRVATIVYVIQFCLALTLGMQVYEVLHASIGNSLEITKLLQHYDHTVITDFFKGHGASLTPLLGQLRWLLLVWLLFSVFLDGGLLYSAANPEQGGWRGFWHGAALYFFPFLKIGLVLLLAALVWTALTLGPALVFLQPSIEVFPSEKYSVWMVLAAAALWLLGIGVLFIWSVLSRLERMKGRTTGTALKAGWRRFRANKWRLLGTILAFVLLQGLLIALYWWLVSLIGMESGGAILVVFLLQQGLVWGRVVLRVGGYGGVGIEKPLG